MEKICVFNEEISKNTLEIEFDDNKCWINNYHVDQNYGKLFAIMLKTAIDKMKSNGCTKFLQLVSNDDWDNFLSKNDEWELIHRHDEETSLIECSIDRAGDCIMQAFLDC